MTAEQQRVFDALVATFENWRDKRFTRAERRRVGLIVEPGARREAAQMKTLPIDGRHWRAWLRALYPLTSADVPFRC